MKNNENRSWRNDIAEKLNLRTIHGIPRNNRTFNNYDKAVDMQNNNLSKGHLSEKHIASHQIKIDISTANERRDGALKDLKKKYFNVFIFFGRYNEDKAIPKSMKAIMADIHPPRTVNKLYNTKHTMSPFAKRNGKRAKLIRPFTVFVGIMKQKGKEVRRRVIQSMVTKYNRKNFKMVIAQSNIAIDKSL